MLLDLAFLLKMDSGSSTSAFSDRSTQILDAEDLNLTKESTTIQSKVSVITEKKKVKVETKFVLPRGQNVFLAMKTTEQIIDKVQKLSE